jgi:hypothetical protein
LAVAKGVEIVRALGLDQRYGFKLPDPMRTAAE